MRVQIQRNEWRRLGFPAQAAPDCVDTLMDSHVAYQIALFSHEVRLDHDNHPLILVEGVWTRWDEVRARIEYDEVRESLVSKADRSIVWNYISPQGLVPKDPSANELYPILELDFEKYKALKAHAEGFWQGHVEVDPGSQKPCILQLFTTQKSQHVGLRLISGEGKLYSFGIRITPTFLQYHDQFPLRIFVTGYTKFVTPDYLEHYPFGKRYVTSIPITKERLESIISFANAVNRGAGMRYCLSGPNCATVAQRVLKLAGVDVEVKVSLAQAVCIAISERIPCIESSFMWLCKKVETVFSSILNVHPLTKLTAGVTSLFLLALGAGKEVEPAQEEQEQRSLIPTWYDLFKESNLIVDHSYQLFLWQKQHPHATQIFSYEGRPKLCI